MKHTSLVMILTCLIAGSAGASIINPTLVSSASNDFAGGENTNLTDNSGLSASVDTGDALSDALAVTHSFNGGYTESWVTNASGSDYFAAGPTPVIVYDLGQDVRIDDFIAWQYQNTGGGGTSAGNAARSVDLRFNTEAQGSGSFAGAATSLTIKPVHDGDGAGANDLGGVNSAQQFGLSETYARYVQVTVTDNYRGFQGITSGGDRVGLGELRLNATELFCVDVVNSSATISGDAGTAVGNLVNGSGLAGPVEWNTVADVNHAGYTDGSAHYVTGSNSGDYFSNQPAPVLTFELADASKLTALAVWNYTGQSFNSPGNGASEILVEVSSNGVDYETVATIFPSIVPNSSGANPGEFLSLGGDFLASYVRLTLLDNYWDGIVSGGDRVGLAEVKFIAAVPAPAALPAGLALLALAAGRRRI